MIVESGLGEDSVAIWDMGVWQHLKTRDKFAMIRGHNRLSILAHDRRRMAPSRSNKAPILMSGHRNGSAQ